MNQAIKHQQLTALKQQIIDNRVCPELAESATQLVFGDGNLNADIIFIGEAPGKQEDKQGVPFVGAAGKFLDKLLATINLSRQNVYITNIVKYRPPNNRDPKPEEKQAFWPYLRRQIGIIKPRILVTLGRHSLQCLLPEVRIGEAHGKPIRTPDINKISNNKQVLTDDSTEGIVILPLYHPAAALYNGSMRQTLIDDFAQIPYILKLTKRTTVTD